MSFSKGGRATDPIRNYFSDIFINGKSKSQCNNCSEIICSQVVRLRTHHKRCAGFNTQIKNTTTDPTDMKWNTSKWNRFFKIVFRVKLNYI